MRGSPWPGLCQKPGWSPCQTPPTAPPKYHPSARAGAVKQTEETKKRGNGSRNDGIAHQDSTIKNSSCSVFRSWTDDGQPIGSLLIPILVLQCIQLAKDCASQVIDGSRLGTFRSLWGSTRRINCWETLLPIVLRWGRNKDARYLHCKLCLTANQITHL